MNLKSLKKFIVATFVASLTCCLVACGGKTSNNNSKTKKETTTQKDSSYSKIKIGALLIGNISDTSGYTYAHAQGIRNAVKSLGMSEDQIVWKNDIPDNLDEASNQATKKAIEECIKDGCNLIFGTSWGYKTVMNDLASKHPDIYFAHGSGDLSNGKNFINYFGRIYQARYLSGIAAGLKTTTNKIGYISAWGTENAECTGGINAFAMGVASVNPKATVYVKTTNTWFDEKKEKDAAKWLIDHDADVIAQHCDTVGPQLVAESAGAYSIGWNSDMSREAPKAVLTSVIWHWDAFYKWCIESIGNGTWNGKDYLGGLKEGLVAITDLSEFNHPDAAAKIKEAQDKMINGNWDVFNGVIETNDGKTIGEAGKSLPDKDILFKINWYYKNVELVK